MDKSKKYNLFFAIFIMSILVFSILGYSIKGDNPNTIKYKDIKFTKNNQGFYTARINDRLISLSNNPKDLEDIPNININILKLNTLQKIYVTTDPLEPIDNFPQGFNIYILPLITTTIRPACFTDNEVCINLPLKDCSDADLNTEIILIKKSNINKIELTNNCLIIQGNSQELTKIIDKWILELYINE